MHLVIDFSSYFSFMQIHVRARPQGDGLHFALVGTTAEVRIFPLVGHQESFGSNSSIISRSQPGLEVDFGCHCFSKWIWELGCMVKWKSFEECTCTKHLLK